MNLPEKGNVVDHRLLFDRPAAGHAAGPARLWRLSPFGYRGFIDGLTDGLVAPETGPRRAAISAPFGLVNEPGFRDYSIRYAVGASEAEQLANNARLTIEYLLAERRGGQILAPPAVAAIDRHTGSPTQAEIDAAVTAMFRKVLLRSPKEDEQHRYAEFLARNLANLGNHDGLVRGLAPLFLHPEGVFRLELSAGPADEHGRRLLARLSLAQAIAYALTDNPPDDLLLAAANEGRLASADDVRREVCRILDDPLMERPRLLRFFQEYFGYAVRPGVLPLLAFGWGTLERMRENGISYASSAWGPQIPAPLFCDPNLAFSNLFGVAREGLDRRLFEADTELFEFARQDADRLDRQLSGPERARFATYRDGLATVAEQRRRLLAMTDQLAAHAPAVTDRFTKPRFETDWWEASLDVATSALIAGVTNVVTICSGFCESTGSWNGLSLSRQGHAMGHQNQEEAEDWLVLRRYNMHHLLQVVRALEAAPEGTGSMMDNTLIVYTSCHGERQHSKGDRWPFLLIGNLGGAIRSGRYISYPVYPHQQARSINALYLTLLHAFGDRRDHFNLTGPIATVDRHGPLEELLA